MKTRTSTFSLKDLPPIIFTAEESDTKIELYADDIKISFKHALVEHNFIGNNAAYVENMGRGSKKISLIAYFFANFKSSFNEPMYPDVYQKFLKICEKSVHSPGKLEHPDGDIPCYVASFDTTLSTKAMDGAIIKVDFLETIENIYEISDSDDVSGMLTPMLFDAEALDLAVYKMKMKLKFQIEKMDNLLKKKLGIDAFVNSIIKYSDMVKLTRDRVIGRFDNILNSLTRLRDSVKRLVDQVKLDLKVAADVLDAAKKLFDNIVIAKAAVEKIDYKYYVTSKASTITSIAKEVKHNPDWLLKYNPKIAKTPLIPKDTVIKFPRVGG
jgi:uncharacterized protein YktA (UPF0223 family)